MSIVKRLVAGIVQFLGEELRSDELSSDAKESLEVAIQCLESSYDVSSSDAYLLPSRSLLEIFKDAVKDEPISTETSVTEEAKREAEVFKTEGNNLMKLEKFAEALKCYTKAIQLDPKNPVFYCNRAAAYSKLNNHSFALEDCQRAIEIDPSYSKAYGRMGLAYASLNDHRRAKECYKKAVDLEPQNEGYRNNYKIAEEKVAEEERQGGGAFDFASILSNPAIMNMATQVMQDPSMQNIIGSLMTGNLGGAAAGGAPGDGVDAAASGQGAPGAPGGPGGPGGPGLEAFLRAGQQLAAQMQQSNPDFVEQLRRQMGPPGSRPNPDNPDGTSGGSA